MYRFEQVSVNGTVANDSLRYEYNFVNTLLRYFKGQYCNRIRVTYRGKIVWKFKASGLRDKEIIYISSDEKDCIVLARYESKKRKPYTLYYMQEGKVINTYSFDVSNCNSYIGLSDIVFSDEVISWIKAQGVVLCQ